jgi:hypothetical protein
VKNFTLQRRPIDAKALLRGAVAETDTSTIISEPGVYSVDGRPAIIYGHLQGDYTRLKWALKSISLTNYYRQSFNLISSHRYNDAGKKAGGGECKTFGFRPPVKQNALANYCSCSGLANSHPLQHGLICKFGVLLDDVYQTYAPDTYAHHRRQLEQIRPEWIIPETSFTSGIINRNNNLSYHYDRGNFEDVFSCMVVFRKGCTGGMLSVPEFDVRFLIEDASIFLFDGQKILHGVTPIHLQTSDAYRYSVIYYALKCMSKCGSYTEELSRARKSRVTTEKKRC